MSRSPAFFFNFKTFNGKITERKGSELDMKSLSKCLTKYCAITKYFNMYTADFERKLKETAARDFSQDKLCLFYLSSHGLEGDVLYTRDGSIGIDKIVENFNDTNCPSLKGKPKIFIIQMCRGNTFDEGVVGQEAESGAPLGIDSFENVSQEAVDSVHLIDEEILRNFKVVPSAFNDCLLRLSAVMPSECLVAYSTTPDRYSWRSKSKGGYYIQKFVQALEDFSSRGETLNILRLLTITNRRLALDFESSGKNKGNKQVGHYISTLTNRVSLEPTSTY